MTDVVSAPLDTEAVAALGARGLRMGLVDPADDAQVRTWYEAVGRGFLDPQQTDAGVAEVAPDLARGRTIGVWDADDPDTAQPVATTTGWTTALSVPGGSVDAWAVSDVTVAPTHRRRGIGRIVLEADLRTAAAAGLPMAVLTASEATIYPRFGYGPAAQIADLEIDTPRAGWTGGTAPGRLRFVGRDDALAVAPALLEAARARRPGRIGLSGFLLTRLFGAVSEPDKLRQYRYVRYDDAEGAAQGVLAYTVEESAADFTRSTLFVKQLVASTDEANAALWRLALEHDLVTRVVAVLRSTDDPLRWLVADQRAVRTTALRDHLWVRVLDPVAALTARTYAAPGRIVLEVDDRLGFAAGRFLLDVGADGRAGVTPLEAAAPPDAAAVRLDVSDLGAISLGGPSALTLARAGRIVEQRPGSVALLDRVFRSPLVPHLGVWF